MPILTTAEKSGYDKVVTESVRKADVIDNLSSAEVQMPLSAKQGKVLNDKLGEMTGALVFKGTLDASGAASQLANAKVGWLWVVNIAGTLLGKALKVGEEVYCKTAVTGTPTSFNNFEFVPTQDGTLHTSDVVNSLVSTAADKPLSANMGKTLNDSLSGFSDPLKSEVDYKKVINSKRWSLINLSGVMSIENTFGVTQGDLQQLLRTNEKSQNFYFNNDDIVNKYFKFNYMHNVWMKSVSILIDRTATISVGMQWQASSNGSSWVDIGTTIAGSLPSTSSLNFKGQYEIKIPNIATKTQSYRYWRIFGVGGSTTSRPYVNLIFPEIE